MSVWNRVVAFAPTIPSYVWLGMIALAGLLLAFSTMVRAREKANLAQGARTYTQSLVASANSENAALKERTYQLRTNVNAAAQVAQAQLHHVRANEIVIATK
ncbi:MAG: hypothetical protein HOP19_24195 [Acidobacteria bacterium]|nr:hypothetical protein [Acidobacteriota bacterium]